MKEFGDKVIGNRWIYLEIHTPRRMGYLRRRETQNTEWLVFMGWVISLANKWEDYSNYLGEEAGISRNWATAHFLAFYGRPWNCHGAGGFFI